MNPLHIANTPDGLSLIEDLRGLGHHVKLRPRNKNRKQFYKFGGAQRRNYDGTLCKHSYQQDLPRKFASHFAIYTSPKAENILESLINIAVKKGLKVLPQ